MLPIMNRLIKRIEGVSIEARSSIALTGATFFCKGLNIIATPIFTRILSTYEMGIVTTYTSLYTILSVFANLALDSGSFNIAMMDYKDRRDKYISFILALSFLSSSLMVVLYLLFGPIIEKTLGLDSKIMILMLVSFFVLPATNFWMLRQRYEYKYIRLSAMTVLSSGGSIILAAVLTLIASRKGADNLAGIRLLAGNILPIIVGIILSVHIFAKGKTLYNKKFGEFVLIVNTPLLVHSLAKHFFDVSDRIMISAMVGKSEVGIYGVIYSVSALSLILWNSINASLIPYIFANMDKGKAGKSAIRKTTSIMLLFYAVFCVLLTIIAPEIIRVLATKEYYEAIYLMPPIAAGIFFTSLYNLFSNVLLYYKATKSIMIATVVTTVFNIVANYIFISMFGYVAASYTTLCSYILLALMQLRSLKKVDRDVPYNLRYIMIISIALMVICLMCNLIYNLNIFRYIIIGVVFILVFIFKDKIKLQYAALKKG